MNKNEPDECSCRYSTRNICEWHELNLSDKDKKQFYDECDNPNSEYHRVNKMLKELAINSYLKGNTASEIVGGMKSCGSEEEVAKLTEVLKILFKE